MDALENLISTAEPAFACDRKGSIVAWNEAAEKLLGHTASEVIGKRCYEVLGGNDIFGNRFCDKRCAIQNMVHRQEPVHHCRLRYRTASSSQVDVSVYVFVVYGGARSEYIVVHVLKPLASSNCETLAGVRISPEHVDSPREPAQSSGLSGDLTTREIEVLRTLADGSSTSEIAKRLCISEATVRNHVRNILSKLEVHSRLEAVCLATHRRLI